MMKDKIGKFDIVRFINSGSFGEVWEVKDSSGQRFAIKEIKKEKLVEAQMLEKLKSEAKVSTQLDHKNIIKCHSTMQSENSFYLVFELCSGGNMEDYIKAQKRLPISEALHYIKQLKDAYHYLYSKKIIHRDIKLENILLKSREDKILKLSDFGCSKVDTIGNTFIGTPKYMAYELLIKKLRHEEVSYDYKADIWAFGLCAWEMVFGFGSFPFKFPDMRVLAEESRNFSGDDLRFPAQPKLHPAFYDFFRRTIEYRTERRLTAEELFAHPIFSLSKEALDPSVSEPSFRKNPSVLFFQDRLDELKAIQFTAKSLFPYLSQISDKEIYSNMCCLILILINKGRIKTENAFNSIRAKKNTLDAPDFESFLTSSNCKETTRSLEKFLSEFVSADEGVYDLLKTKCTNSSLLADLEDNLYKGQTTHQQEFYKTTYMFILSKMKTQVGSSEKQKLDVNMKRVLKILRGEILPNKDLFEI